MVQMTLRNGYKMTILYISYEVESCFAMYQRKTSTYFSFVADP